MTVSYQKNAKDVWQDLSYLALRTRTGRLLLAFALMLLLFIPLLIFSSTPPGPQAAHEVLTVLLPIIAVVYAIGALCILLGVCLAVALMPEITISAQPDGCGVVYLRSTKVPWLTFQRMAEEPEFFYFLSWQRMVFIPKRAFASRAEADKFFHTALTYWHNAKGIVPPSPPAASVPSGVWPPAPQTTAAQEESRSK